MKTYSGKGVYDGIAIGRICVYRNEKQKIVCRTVEDIEAECNRYASARVAVLKDLAVLYEQTKATAGEEAAAIFDVHQMMLEDGNYNEAIEKMICGERVNAEYAVSEVGAYYAELFAGMEDAYIRERASDILDISEQLVNRLSGSRRKENICDESVIIVADDLTPSQTVQLDRNRVLAFVTKRGSLTSHVAILAKTMEIPAIVGADFDEEGLHGLEGAVDGREGLFYVEPDEAVVEALKARIQGMQSESLSWEEYRGKETVSADGRKIQLLANVGNLHDVKTALKNDAEGIGLFRTELLYLEREDYPTETEQFEIYKQVMEIVGNKPVIFRTLDIGADKQSTYMNLPAEQNPALGCRGIRVCLMEPGILKTQLRALFRAAQFGDLRVMYPMITSVAEIEQIREIAELVKQELAAEGLLFKVPSQGIMIETPAAALVSAELAKEVDFFSIGTNDLTQYTLACDRENGGLERFYDAHHPAVLKLIAMTAENAHNAGIPVGICGELAGDEKLLGQWLQLGVEELSVTPGSILRLRSRIADLKLD